MPCHGNIACTSKSPMAYDVVTEIDIQVEHFLRDELSKTYPNIPFVGEETGGDRSAPVKWLCDPIDGTSYYVRGLPFCTTMLALIDSGEVIFSIIYDFVNDAIFHAQRGKGAFREQEPIHVSNRSLSGSYMSWETHIDKLENLETHLELKEHSSFFKTICAGWEFAMVAMGKLDGRICFDPYGKDYDFAPGSLLVQEAGGVVANLGTTTYDYTNLDFIAANPTIFKELTEGQDAIFPIE